MCKITQIQFVCYVNPSVKNSEFGGPLGVQVNITKASVGRGIGSTLVRNQSCMSQSKHKEKEN